MSRGGGEDERQVLGVLAPRGREKCLSDLLKGAISRYFAPV